MILHVFHSQILYFLQISLIYSSEWETVELCRAWNPKSLWSNYWTLLSETCLRKLGLFFISCAVRDGAPCLAIALQVLRDVHLGLLNLGGGGDKTDSPKSLHCFTNLWTLYQQTSVRVAIYFNLCSSLYKASSAAMSSFIATLLGLYNRVAQVQSNCRQIWRNNTQHTETDPNPMTGWHKLMDMVHYHITAKYD